MVKKTEEAEKIISPPEISAENMELFVSDLKELDKVLSTTGSKEIIENILEATLTGHIPLTSFRNVLGNTFGDIVAHLIVFILDDNDLSFLQKLRRTDAPKEVLDFIEQITIKYGFFFNDFQRRLHYPKEISSMHVTHYYNFDEEELVLKTDFFTREDKVFNFEAPATAYLWLTRTLLRHISTAYSEAKKAKPNLKIDKFAGILKDIHKTTEEIENLSQKKPANKRAKA